MRLSFLVNAIPTRMVQPFFSFPELAPNVQRLTKQSFIASCLQPVTLSEEWMISNTSAMTATQTPKNWTWKKSTCKSPSNLSLKRIMRSSGVIFGVDQTHCSLHFQTVEWSIRKMVVQLHSRTMAPRPSRPSRKRDEIDRVQMLFLPRWMCKPSNRILSREIPLDKEWSRGLSNPGYPEILWSKRLVYE